MTSRVAGLEAEIEMLKLEEAFAAIKADYQAGTLNQVAYDKAKLKLRETRQKYRELREARIPEPGEVRPATTKVAKKQ